MLRVTADTNIYISALNFGGMPERLLLLAEEGNIQLIVSNAILTEVAEVLRGDKFAWPEPEIDKALRQLSRIAEHVQPTQTLDVVKVDPSDNRILECAAAAKSDYIVTGDLRHLREKSLSGVDIVDEVVRLCGMNLYLHGIGNGESPIRSADALAADPGERFQVILTNPPFGKKSSYKVIGEDGEVDTEREDYEREDFKFTTSNKQLNFLQHIMTIMETNGRAAVVLPDNVLFEAGSAGEGIRKRLLTQFNFHTLMRLPTGIFYKPGVKANVLFFEKHPPRADGQPNTKALWIYDFRTNLHFTLRKNSLKASDLDDFVDCYRKREQTERFRCFPVDDLLKRDKLNLDIFWLKDESLDDVDSLPPPDEIAAEIVENLQAALEQFQSVAAELAR